MGASGTQLERERGAGAALQGRSPMAHLLHALNQPLTGLQCSLELAVAGPRRIDQYVQTLRDGLELTGRMRDLVEAMRELAEVQPVERQTAEPFLLDGLVRETAADLLPVSEARNVRLKVSSHTSLPVRADRHEITKLVFRLLESALSLTRPGADLQVAASRDQGQACLLVSWRPGTAPAHSPFSRPELGLLIAQAGWRQAGAEWSQSHTDDIQTRIIRLPLAPGSSTGEPRGTGDLK
jgi:signal transduction histidine kinase